MSTTLNRVSSMSSSRARTRTWPAISPAVRLRAIPILPVRQNAHCIAHPTCVETQKVIERVSGMKTDSICLPSARRSRNFVVRSLERSRRTTSGVVTARLVASAARKSRPRSLISPKSVIPRLCTHRKIWRAWKRGCPRSSSTCSSSCSSSSAMSGRLLVNMARTGGGRLRRGERRLYYAGPAGPVGLSAGSTPELRLELHGFTVVNSALPGASHNPFYSNKLQLSGSSPTNGHSRSPQ